MFVAEIAPQVDRLVWTVNFQAADSGAYRPAFREAGLGDVEFGRVANYVPAFSAAAVPEAILLRRFRYLPEGEVRRFIATMASEGCIAESAEGYAATNRFAAVMTAVAAALSSVAEETWAGHDDDVAVASTLTRRVLDTAPSSPLLDAYRGAAEPASEPGTLHQRLAILRLVRNEAHAAAWAVRGLNANDMVVLTTLWNGDDLGGRSWHGAQELVADGSLTADGRRLRTEIEADTNRRNEPAFASLNGAEKAAYLDAVTALPGTPG